MTKFNTIHYYSRYTDINTEISKKVCKRHEFISPTDSKGDAKAKLVLKIKYSINNMCNTCLSNVLFSS